MIRTFDLKQQFDAIKKSTVEAINNIFPVEGKKRKVVLNKVIINDTASSSDYNDQLKTKLRESTWGVPVFVSLSLIDKETNKVIDSVRKMKLLTIPKATDRFSYIVGGNEYQVSNQLRLKPGVYTVRKQNGELRTQVNLAVGKNFDIYFNEEKAQFSITKVAGTQSSVPLYPILIALGVLPSQMAEAWGKRITDANITNDPRAIEKAISIFNIKKGDIAKEFGKTKMDPEVNKRTLGEAFDKVSGPMLLAASKKLLEVHLGKQKPEDRDSLEYKSIHSIDDFIKERLEKNRESLIYKLKRLIDSPKKVKLSQLINPGNFNSVIESFFTQDDKSNSSEQTNPLEMLSGQHKTTVMGAGGISSVHQVKPEMREIHSSHFGFLDPVATPESDRIGLNNTLPLGVVKDGQEIKKVVYDKSGNIVTITPQQAYKSKIAFPGQQGPKYKIIHEGKISEVQKSEVDYFTPDSKMMFSWSTNLIPFLPTIQGNRSMMASKHLEQAISLKHREAPLVQVAGPTGKTMEESVGDHAVLKSPVDGVIKKIDNKFIYIKSGRETVKLDLYHNFPLNRKTFITHHVVVKEGEKVKKGQLLADSNYTKNGTLALGVNLKTAYIPYKGLNFEDGIVVSESGAKKLTSEHIHKKNLAVNDNTIIGLNKYKMNYPNTFTTKNLSKLDENGVIKKGQTVEMGDAVILAMQKRSAIEEIGVLSKALSNRPSDISVVWQYEDPGVVTEVTKSSKSIIVYIRTEEPAKVGDKMSGVYGNKGVITAIIPDSDAPKTKDGKPVEVLLNPHGVISRINIGQIYNSAAGKAAHKMGKPHVVNNFSGENYLDSTKKLLQESGVDDKEELFDADGKSLGKVHVGMPYMLKLFKQSHGNFSYRQGGPGSPYDANLQPLKAGGEESSKAIDMLSMYAMLAHGARANLRDMVTIKSDKNDEYWNALKSGQMLPPPKSPFVYDKFLSYLKSSGIDVKKSGSKLTLVPMTDKEIKRLSSGEISEPKMIRGKDLKPIKDGLFDPVKLGGIKGTRWGHITLTEPTVNPTFEAAVKKLTGIGPKYEQLMSGKLFLDKEGKFNSEGRGVTGGAAIEKLLDKIDVEEGIKVLETQIKRAKGDKLDDLNKKLRFLYALKKNNLTPSEAYIRKVMPVIPPVYRPTYSMPDGNLTTSDSNFLYQNLGVLNNLTKTPVYDMLPDEDKADIRKDIYEHVKGISGITDINIKGRPRQGFISEIKGGAKGSPKEGFFLSKMLSKKQDYTGRATIIPESSLHVDEVGIPEKMAWKIFEPFIIRELSRFGKTFNEGMKEIQNKTPLAKRALEIVMRDRKVLIKRDPVLHKFNVMAMKPILTPGSSIKIPPLITKGFNADHDGDTMMVHVPISNEANAEAEKMLPSRNLYQPGTGKLMVAPSQEAQIGIFYLSQTKEGRKKLNKHLPASFKVEDTLNKKRTQELLLSISKAVPAQEYAKIVQAIKTEGEAYALESGFTLGVEDLGGFERERNILLKLAPNLEGRTQEEIQKGSSRINKIVDSILERKLKNKKNPLYDMVDSGARGDPSQLRSILFSQLYVQDAKGKIIPTMIKKNYSEGLEPHEYWASVYGARKGMIDKSVQTSLPGSFSKDVLANTIDNVISASDCGTKRGTTLPITSSDVLDRFLADEQHGFSRNTLVNQSLLNTLKKKGVKTILVRSPLTCLQPKGVCSKCFGLNENGHEAEIGENVGAKSGQAISEPLMQGIMNTFHTGGAAGTGLSVTGYQRVKQLLDMPAIVVGSTSLAPIEGKVKKITKKPAGGYDILIEDVNVHIARGLNLKVSVGDKVKRGEPLSEGVIKPQDMAKHKGMTATQEYIVDEMNNAYKSLGQNIQRKMFETVVRSVANFTKVKNMPRGSGWIPGDVVPHTIVEDYNRNLEKAVPISEAVGEVLAKGVGGLRPGHELTNRDVMTLKSAGLGTVIVRREQVEHEPVMKGLSQLPLLKKNWMSALGYQNLAKALLEGVTQSWDTDLSDYHPVPALAHGATFGKGQQGRY